MTQKVGIERIPTGIAHFDTILEGGLVRGAVYIVHGPPGAGKTIMGNQICFNHAQAGGQAVYITLLAESHARMLAHLGRMSFFKPELIPESVYYLSAFKVLEEEGLSGLVRTLRSAITRGRTTFLVLDGFVSAEEASHSPKELKKFIHELQSFTTMSGCTTLLLGSNERLTDVHPEHTMVDGIIELSDELYSSRPLRHVRVRKMRGVAQVRGEHTFEITDDGIQVHPRFESRPHLPIPKRPSSDHEERVGFGIESLDTMLHGGLPGRSTTMILGSSGAGKTILGMHYLAEGIRRGEPGVYFGFYEDPAALLQKSRRLGLEFHTPAAQKLLRIVWHTPVEHVIDILGEQLFDAVEKIGARRLFIDGLSGFQRALDDFPDRVRGVLATMTEELERRNVTTVFTAETHALFGPTIELPIAEVSAVTQNILLMRHVELNSRLHRLISIIKLRDSNYDPSIREFRIGDQGVIVGDDFAADRILTGSARQTDRKKATRRKR